MNEQSMLEVAKEVMGITGYQQYVPDTWDRKIRGFFGAPLVVIVDLWNRIGQVKRQTLEAKPKHLLWALVFLHVYSTEEIHCRIVGAKDPKLYREWTWFMIDQIAKLKEQIIRLDRRFENASHESTCLLTVDGTDCPVMEPWPFDSKWYSKKFNGPAVKYEVGVSIFNGFICWVNGPFCASTNDATIFKDGLAHHLCSDEGVEADSGYKGHDALKTPTVATDRRARKQKSVARGYHEIVNGSLKVYNVLNAPFHHMNPRNKMMEKHGNCFAAVSVVTQLKFEHCGIPFKVNYDVNYE